MLPKVIIFLLFLVSFTLLLTYIVFSPKHWQSVTFQQKILPIQRDDFNIPIIHASSMEEYLYSLGTVIAQDRLFQISFRNRLMQGRLSQDLGEKTLDIDKFMRQLNFKGWSQKMASRLKRQNYTYYEKLKSFADGINHRVQKMSFLPFQFYLTGLKWQPFNVDHIFNLHFACLWTLSMNYVDQYTRSLLLVNYTKEEIQWLLPNKKETWAFKSIPIVSEQEIPDHLRTSLIDHVLKEIYFNPTKINKIIELDIFQQLPGQAATNTWSISGNHTQSGKPLLVNDPHLELIVPHTFYQIKVNYTHNGKQIFFAGLMPAGALIPVGQSNYFASGCSISHGDSQDLYRQKIQGDSYLLNDEWKKLKIRKEIIKYKTSKGVVEQQYLVKQTHRGPIINYIFGSLGSFKIPEQDDISFVWSYFNQEYQSLLEVILSFTINNIQDLQHYLQNNKTNSLYPVNINLITADNHILMQQAGLHPIRKNSDSGNYIKDGTTTEHDWIGFIPPQYRMHIKDPLKGYIIHSNNRVAEAQYFGGYLNHTIYTARADRIDELIKAQIKSGRKIGVDFAKKVLLDTVDIYCRQILPQILESVNDSKDSHSKFDCNFTSQSYLASMYEVFMYQLHHLIKPVSFQKMNLISFHWSQQNLFNYIHRAHQGNNTHRINLNQAWKKMIQHLRKRFNTQDITKWTWGKLHKDLIRHPAFGGHPWLKYIFNIQTEGSGNMHTPNMAKMQRLQFSHFETTQRADYRAIYTFGENQKSIWSAGTGTSESIFSRHYSDQWHVFKQGNLIPIQFKATISSQL